MSMGAMGIFHGIELWVDRRYILALNMDNYGNRIP